MHRSPSAGAGARTSFSITMKKDTKAKLEMVASFYQQSLAYHIEQLVQDEVDSVDDETWKLMHKVRERLDVTRGPRKAKMRRKVHNHAGNEA